MSYGLPVISPPGSFATNQLTRHQETISPPTISPPSKVIILLATKHNKNESTVCGGELAAQTNFFCTCLFKSYNVKKSVN